jgi:hypothetical protein
MCPSSPCLLRKQRWICCLLAIEAGENSFNLFLFFQRLKARSILMGYDTNKFRCPDICFHASFFNGSEPDDLGRYYSQGDPYPATPLLCDGRGFLALWRKRKDRKAAAQVPCECGGKESISRRKNLRRRERKPAACCQLLPEKIVPGGAKTGTKYLNFEFRPIFVRSPLLLLLTERKSATIE